MQSSTDLCVTVQLYSLCLLLAVQTGLWLETKQDKTTTRQNSSKLEASLALAEAEVGAMAKADQH